MKKSRSKKLLVLLLLAALAGLLFLATKPGRDIAYKAYYRVDHLDYILPRCKELKLDPYLVAAMIFTESRFRSQAVSEVGARGLMQLMPDTAAEMARTEGIVRFETAKLLEPEFNIQLGTRYFRILMDRFQSADIALAAYNAGPSLVQSWLEQNSAPEYPETRAYVSEVGKHRKRLRELYPGWTKATQ